MELASNPNHFQNMGSFFSFKGTMTIELKEKKRKNPAGKTINLSQGFG